MPAQYTRVSAWSAVEVRQASEAADAGPLSQALAAFLAQHGTQEWIGLSSHLYAQLGTYAAADPTIDVRPPLWPRDTRVLLNRLREQQGALLSLGIRVGHRRLRSGPELTVTIDMPSTDAIDATGRS